MAFLSYFLILKHPFFRICKAVFSPYFSTALIYSTKLKAGCLGVVTSFIKSVIQNPIIIYPCSFHFLILMIILFFQNKCYSIFCFLSCCNKSSILLFIKSILICAAHLSQIWIPSLSDKSTF